MNKSGERVVGICGEVSSRPIGTRLWALLLVAVGLLGLAEPALAARPRSRAERPAAGHSPAPAKEAAGPGTTSWIVVSAATGEEVSSQEPDRPGAPASMTKMMLALLVMEAELAGDALVVRTRNSGQIGHVFPTGPTDLFQVWLSVRVTDERGRVVLEIGAHGPEGAPELGDRLFDAVGGDDHAQHGTRVLWIGLHHIMWDLPSAHEIGLVAQIIGHRRGLADRSQHSRTAR